MSKGAFSLFELILIIILIIAILSAIAIPKFISLKEEANKASCDGNVAAIRAALTAFYANTAAAGEARFPSSLYERTFVENYFADGVLPQCPFGEPYSYDSNTGVVKAHRH